MFGAEDLKWFFETKGKILAYHGMYGSAYFRGILYGKSNSVYEPSYYERNREKCLRASRERGERLRRESAKKAAGLAK